MSRLRHRRPGRRPRRLRGGALRRLGRPVGGAGREGEGRRHLPAPRLHPGQGAAARRRGVPHGRPRGRARGEAARRGSPSRTGRRPTSARAASSTSCTRGCRGCSSGARSPSSTAWAGSPPTARSRSTARPLRGRGVIVCAGSVPRSSRAWRSTASASSPPTTRPTATPTAARAGRGDRRRRDRRGVRVGLHRPGCADHAAGGAAARRAADRAGPRRRRRARPLAEAARHRRSTPRPGSARWSTPATACSSRSRPPRARRRSRSTRCWFDRPPAGHRGHRGRGGRGAVDRPRVRRGRHRRRCRPRGPACTPSATASPPPGWPTSPTPRPSSPSSGSSARTRRRSTTARCPGSSTPTPRSPGPG